MMRALATAATGLEAQQLAVDVIANNLANVSTIGFKKSFAEFQDLMYQTAKAPGTSTGIGLLPVGIQVGLGVKPVAVHRQFQQGSFQQTQNSLDLAIEGDGFFQVTLPNGSLAFTRAGSFKIDDQARVVTAEGHLLTPNIIVPDETTTINVNPQGQVFAVTTGTPEPTELGQILLARFINPAGLNSIGKNLFQPTLASGESIPGEPGLAGFGTILQSALEASNVNIAEELVNMIVAQRAYEINSKAIQTSDEMLSTVNNLKR